MAGAREPARYVMSDDERAAVRSRLIEENSCPTKWWRKRTNATVDEGSIWRRHGSLVRLM